MDQYEIWFDGVNWMHLSQNGVQCPSLMKRQWNYINRQRSEISYRATVIFWRRNLFLNPLNADLNPICHLLALLEAHHILHVSRVRVKVIRCYPWSWFQTRSEICSAERQTKLHSEELSIYLGLRATRIPVCLQYIGILGVCGQGCCYVYDSVRHAEGSGLLSAKGCDRTAALTPCTQKHPLKLSAYIKRTAVYAWSAMWPWS